jgi:hypothetical protein
MITSMPVEGWGWHPGCAARVGDVLDRDRHGRIRFVRLFAGEHFEKDDTKRINVRTAVHRLAGGLLGSHVRRRADDGAPGDVASLGLGNLAMPKSEM